jgi:hypothetical protein
VRHPNPYVLRKAVNVSLDQPGNTGGDRLEVLIKPRHRTVIDLKGTVFRALGAISLDIQPFSCVMNEVNDYTVLYRVETLVYELDEGVDTNLRPRGILESVSSESRVVLDTREQRRGRERQAERESLFPAEGSLLLGSKRCEASGSRDACVHLV